MYSTSFSGAQYAAASCRDVQQREGLAAYECHLRISEEEFLSLALSNILAGRSNRALFRHSVPLQQFHTPPLPVTFGGARVAPGGACVACYRVHLR